MKVKELLALLNDLPVEALEKDIHIANSFGDHYTLEPVTVSCVDTTIVGYVLVKSDKELRVN